jgi:hypothetical protein
MVMQQVVVLSGAGLAVGGLLAFALSSLIRSQLYGLQPHDPFTYVSAAVVLAAAACAVRQALSLLCGQAAWILCMLFVTSKRLSKLYSLSPTGWPDGNGRASP